MSIVNTVGRGVAWNTVSTIIGKFVIFLNVFLMLTYLSVYYYGLAQLVLSVVAAVGIFLLPGLSGVILADLVVERARGEFGKMKSLFLQFFWLNIGLALIGWAVLFFGADTAAHWASNDAIGYLLKISSFSLLISPLRTVSTLLPGVELRYFDQSFYLIAEEIVKLICLCIFFFVMNLGITGLLYAIVVSQFVTVLLYLPRSLSAYRVFGTAHAEDQHAFWRILHSHRRWGIVNSYIGTLASTLQIWIVRLLLGTEAVGLFSFAEGILGQVTAFLPLGNVLAPLLPRYADKPAEFARYVRSSIKAQLLFCIPLIIATFAGLPVLVLILPKYMPAVPIIVFMIWSIIPSAVVSVYTPAFTALKGQYAYFWSTVWKTVFTTIFTWLAIVFWGIPGIGIGMVLLTAANMVERSWRLKHILPEFTFSLRDIFTFDAYERTLIQKVLDRWLKIRSTLLKNTRL